MKIISILDYGTPAAGGSGSPASPLLPGFRPMGGVNLPVGNTPGSASFMTDQAVRKSLGRPPPLLDPHGDAQFWKALNASSAVL